MDVSAPGMVADGTAGGAADAASTDLPAADRVAVAQVRAASARALLVTILGLYARDRGGAISVATMVRLLGALQVDGPAARSLISRLKARGVLRPVTVGDAAGYALTSTGRTLLDEGDRRIYGRTTATLADGWLLAVFSVPESQRAQRHSLRARLAALGFGTVSAGVWVAPAHLAAETADVLRLHRLDQYVELFTVATTGDPSAAVARWWDLDTLAGLYRAFITEYRPALDRWVRGGGPDDWANSSGQADASPDVHVPQPDGDADRTASRDENAFADYVRAVTAWRRLPYRDPGLPAEALPRDWPGTAAADLFVGLRRTLGPRAERHVTQVAGLPADPRR